MAKSLGSVWTSTRNLLPNVKGDLIMRIILKLIFRIGIKLLMVPDAGHHIYADQAPFFNNAVNKALGE